MANSIRVNASGGDYDIHIGPGLLARVNEYVPGGKSVVVTNTTLAPLYGQAVASRLSDADLIVIPDGEKYKTLETVARLYTEFVSAGLDRASTVIALGGGVLGDTVGFAAATYMRGVRLMQVPTSLLAMVDSSVGGKVGVDLPQGKNLVGAFKQPDLVLIDPDVLKTLPEREWRCGMAETIKHGLLADEGLLNPAMWKLECAAELVRRAVRVKVDVVQRDPFEQNLRAHLNLGHTFAHAIERVSSYEWLHGEAVGVGLVAAARLSRELGLCHANLSELVEQTVTKAGLPARLDGMSSEDVYEAMGTDKKWISGRNRFVVLHAVGQPEIVENVPKEVVVYVLESLR
jgi:3-dehydroquinate synthase